VALDTPIEDELPFNDYFEYFGPDFRLHISPSNHDNQNSEEYLENSVKQIIENLRHTASRPSVQMHSMVDTLSAYEEDEDQVDPDDRRAQQLVDRKISHDADLSDSEDEGGRRDQQSFKKKEFRKKPETSSAGDKTATPTIKSEPTQSMDTTPSPPKEYASSTLKTTSTTEGAATARTGPTDSTAAAGKKAAATASSKEAAMATGSD